MPTNSLQPANNYCFTYKETKNMKRSRTSHTCSSEIFRIWNHVLRHDDNDVRGRKSSEEQDCCRTAADDPTTTRATKRAATVGCSLLTT